MNLVTAESILAIAEKALAILEKGRLMDAKNLVSKHVTNLCMQPGRNGESCQAEELINVFKGAMAVGRIITFKNAMKELITFAKSKILEITFDNRMADLMERLSAKNMVISEAAAKQAIMQFDNNDDALAYFFNIKAETPITASTNSAEACRRQAQRLRENGENKLALEWEKEAVTREIMIAGGSRLDAANALYKYGVADALASFLEAKTGKVSFFQKDFQLAKELLDIATANLEASEALLVTKPQELYQFQQAVDRHRLAKIALFMRCRKALDLIHPDLDKLLAKAIAGQYIPEEVEERLIRVCMRAGDNP